MKKIIFISAVVLVVLGMCFGGIQLTKHNNQDAYESARDSVYMYVQFISESKTTRIFTHPISDEGAKNEAYFANSEYEMKCHKNGVYSMLKIVYNPNKITEDDLTSYINGHFDIKKIDDILGTYSLEEKGYVITEDLVCDNSTNF